MCFGRPARIHVNSRQNNHQLRIRYCRRLAGCEGDHTADACLVRGEQTCYCLFVLFFCSVGCCAVVVAVLLSSFVCLFVCLFVVAAVLSLLLLLFFFVVLCVFLFAAGCDFS